jgi:hypothetical protein
MSAIGGKVAVLGPAKALEPILTDWRLPAGGLYFVTPTARARPAKVSALADFLIAKLMNAPWTAEAVMGPKPPQRQNAKMTRNPAATH